MMFSRRTAWELGAHELHAATLDARAAGHAVLDLTASNPTTCGFHYPDDLLEPLRAPAALQYSPESLGLPAAREAVARYYGDLGASISPASLCLTTSTSEAYSFLFRLLCDPGDHILAARPSYPLFDYLATLDDVVLDAFPLFYDPSGGGWGLDLEALEAAITPRTRALILVHPNNPTGNFVAAAERTAVEAICLRHDLALIVDEVFLDFSLAEPNPHRTFLAGLAGEGGEPAPLTFVLSGLSKIAGLPQMKCSWIAVRGPAPLVRTAMERLDVIADTFLSMNAPVQLSLDHWLRTRAVFQEQVRDRMRANVAALDRRLRGSSGDRLTLEGGWTAVVRVPRAVDDVPFALAALQRGVLVQPGDFYGLPEGRIVLSLLTPEGRWRQGLDRLPL